jgi:hypothetical protein
LVLPLADFFLPVLLAGFLPLPQSCPSQERKSPIIAKVNKGQIFIFPFNAMRYRRTSAFL